VRRDFAPLVDTAVAGVRTRGRLYPANRHRELRNHETCIQPQFRLSVQAISGSIGLAGPYDGGPLHV
jgi:hypothetical protein